MQSNGNERLKVSGRRPMRLGHSFLQSLLALPIVRLEVRHTFAVEGTLKTDGR